MSVSLFGVLLLLALLLQSYVAETLVKKTNDAIVESQEDIGISLEVEDERVENRFEELIDADSEQRLQDINEDTPNIFGLSEQSEASLKGSIEKTVILENDESVVPEDQDILEKIVEEVKRVTAEQAKLNQNTPSGNNVEERQTEKTTGVENTVAVPLEDSYASEENDDTPLETVDDNEVPSTESDEREENSESEAKEQTSQKHQSEPNAFKNQSPVHKFFNCFKRLQNRISRLFERIISSFFLFIQKLFRFK